MIIRHRKQLTALQRDWHTREQRMINHDPRIDRDSFIVKMTHGVIALGLLFIVGFFLWQIFSDAGRAFFYSLAGG